MHLSAHYVILLMTQFAPYLHTRYGASLGGPLGDTSKMYVWQVQLASHESETTQKALIV